MECPKLESLRFEFDGTDIGIPLGCQNLKSLAIYDWWTDEDVDVDETEVLPFLEKIITAHSSVEKLALLSEDLRVSRWLADMLQSEGVLPNLRQIETSASVKVIKALLDARPNIDIVVNRYFIDKPENGFLQNCSRVKSDLEEEHLMDKTTMANWTKFESEWW